MCTSIIFLQISWWKNFENRSTFAKVIIKHQGASFVGTRWVLNLNGRWHLYFLNVLNCSSSHDSNNCNSVILAHCLLRVQTVIFFCKGEVYPPVPHLTPSPPLCLPFLPLLHLPFLHPSFYPTLLSLQRSGPFKCSYVWGCCKLPHRDGGRIAPAGKSRGAENARQENDGQWIIGRGGGWKCISGKCRTGIWRKLKVQGFRSFGVK